MVQQRRFVNIFTSDTESKAKLTTESAEQVVAAVCGGSANPGNVLALRVWRWEDTHWLKSASQEFVRGQQQSRIVVRHEQCLGELSILLTLQLLWP